MTNDRRSPLLCSLWAVLLIGTSALSPAWGQAEATIEAPAFTLQTIDGDRFQLREHRGEVVVLNFWATWCAPCRREIPEFVELQREYRDQGLQFVGVALQRQDEAEQVQAFAEKMSINYPVGLDDGIIARKYGGVRTLPTTFLIGPEGNVRERFPGLTQRSRLRSELEGLLEPTP